MRKPLSQRFEEMTRLYHFTSFKAACSIIKSGKLKFGKMYKMNDLIESNRMGFGRALQGYLSVDDSRDYKDMLAENEIHKYQQISFSQDLDSEECSYLGFDLHTMWGLYADKGYGVCLVFDKEKLILQDGDYANNVSYHDLVTQDYETHNRSRAGIKTEIWRRRVEIFFTKRKEWEHEQEYRIIRRARNERDDEYLDISNALSFVIICKDYSVCYGESMFDGNYYSDLQYLNRRLPVLVYEYGLDWYTLWPREGDPIWTEQTGFWA